MSDPAASRDKFGKIVWAPLLEQENLEHEDRVICRSSCIGGMESCKCFTNWSPVDDVVDLVEPMGGVDTVFDLELANDNC